MDTKTRRAAEQRLQAFLRDLVRLLVSAERQHWAEMYVRGLLLNGERKSIEPMAARLPGADVQGLRQFVNQSPWAWEPVQEAVAHTVVDHLLPEATYLVDETSFPRQGTHSVCVARQYCSALGKTANCQVAVSVHLGTDAACLPLTWALYLLEAWIGDPARRAEVGVPSEARHQTKGALALRCLDRMLGWELAPRVVIANSEYGNSSDFREALHTPVGCPIACRSRPPRRPGRWHPSRPPPSRPRGAGDRGPGHDGANSRQPTPWSTSPAPSRPRGAPAAKARSRPALPGTPSGAPISGRVGARWRIEHGYRELKDELGLEHFEGRSYTGWYHHVTLVGIAYAFLTPERLRSKKTSRWSLPQVRQRLQRMLLQLADRCPWCGSRLRSNTS